MNDDLRSSVAALVTVWGADAVRSALEVCMGAITGSELRRRRVAAGATGIALAARAVRLDPGGPGAASLAVAVSRWERHDTPPPARARAAIVTALALLEGERAAAELPDSPPDDPDLGASLLARWRALDIAVARWAERASGDACVSPGTASAAIYAWASGRSVPGPRLRAALVAVLEAAEQGAAADAARWREDALATPPPARPAAAPATPAMSLDQLLVLPSERGRSKATTR